MHFKALAALSLLSLSATPIMAQSQAVAPVAKSNVERVSASQNKASHLAGGSDTVLAVLAAAIAAGFVTLTIVNDDDDDAPVSP